MTLKITITEKRMNSCAIQEIASPAWLLKNPPVPIGYKTTTHSCILTWHLSGLGAICMHIEQHI